MGQTVKSKLNMTVKVLPYIVGNIRNQGEKRVKSIVILAGFKRRMDYEIMTTYFQNLE